MTPSGSQCVSVTLDRFCGGVKAPGDLWDSRQPTPCGLTSRKPGCFPLDQHRPGSVAQASPPAVSAGVRTRSANRAAWAPVFTLELGLNRIFIHEDGVLITHSDPPRAFLPHARMALAATGGDPRHGSGDHFQPAGASPRIDQPWKTSSSAASRYCCSSTCSRL